MAVRILASAAILALVLVPWLLGSRAVADAVFWLAQAHAPNDLSLVPRAWALPFFRPIDLLAASITDPLSRDTRFALLLQLPALAALVLGLRELSARLVPDTRAVFPVAVVVLALHTSTSLVVWQIDTVSQSWAAASGLWFVLLLWRTLDRTAAGASPGRLAAAIVGIIVLGLLSKETFVGWWVLGCLVLVLVAVGRLPGGSGRLLGAPRATVPLSLWLAVVPLPVVYLALRLTHDALLQRVLASNSALVGTGGVYRIELGLNVVKNIGLGLMGFLPTGSSHTIFGLDGASLWVRALSPTLLVCCGLLCLWPWLSVALGRAEESRVRERYVPLYLCSMAGLVPLVAVLPIQQISEVYLLGPNVASSLLLATVIVDGLRTPTGRSIQVALVCAALLLGASAMVSRARHMAVGWSYSETLNDALRVHQAQAMNDGDRTLVGVPESCRRGSSYSMVVLKPVQSVYLRLTLRWMRAQRPQRPMAVGEPGAPVDLQLPCDALAPRPRW